MKRLVYLAMALVCAGLTFDLSMTQAQEAPKLSAKQIVAQHQREAAQEEAKREGMEMAPAMIAGHKLTCNLTDARFITSLKSEVNGKESPTSFVEVACENNLGYVIGKRKDGLFVSSDCIETSGRGADGKPSPLRCTLPANSKPYLGLQPQLSASGSKCTINKAAYIGATPAAAVYEVACNDADGLRLTIATPRTADSSLKAVSCYVLMQAGSSTCTLTKPEQSSGFIAALAQKAPKPCAASGSRLVGQTKAGDSYYEFACPDGSGFLVQADAAGAFVRDFTCDQAKPLGGCTLTSVTATAAVAPAAQVQPAQGTPQGTPSAF